MLHRFYICGIIPDDLVLFLSPDVRWVADGFRWNEDEKLRWWLHEELMTMYKKRGFADKIVEIRGGDYQKRLQEAIEIGNSLITQSEEAV
jgi:HTH-type transcriptional regulator, transcriptional repressor of NAD biosynthesis genes